MLRFNQLFIGLLALAFLGAFVVPQRSSDRVKAQVQNLFLPVAWPVRKIAAAVHDRVAPTTPRDEGSPDKPRAAAELIAENSELRLIIENMHGQLEQLMAQNAERAALGDLRDFCRAYPVAGADPAPTRDAIILGGSTFSGLANDMPVVVTGGGLIGRISRAGAAGAQVLLITDRQAQLTGRFVRVTVTGDKDVQIQELVDEPRLVRGIGKGQMLCTIEKKVADTAGLKIGDWLELKDTNWPRLLQGLRIATIISLKPSHYAGFVDITLAPPTKLTALREVMVMVKGQ